MDLSAPSRRALTLIVGALVGTLVLALVIGVVAVGGDDTAQPSRARSGAIALAEDEGGVSAADVDLDSLGSTTTARRSTTGGTVVDTGAVSTDTFSMIGVTWQGGDADVTVRTHSAGGWSRWRSLGLLTDAPDAGTGEGVLGQSATEPTWVGASDGVQVRVAGQDARDPQLALIEPDVETAAYRTLPRKHSRLRPAMRSRASWDADDSLRSGTPYINHTIKQVHIHHTVNSNDYSRDDVAGLIRGMYRYHTQNLGWSDIGYNFLVDRFGRIWVGRKGGPGKNVRGAHTLGFNHASTGVSVIGNFDVAKPNRKVIKAISKVAAWKLNKYDRHPRAWTKVTSHGSDRYPSGERVRLRVIDGHRDTNETACPGRYLYERIKWVRKRTASRMADIRNP